MLFVVGGWKVSEKSLAELAASPNLNITNYSLRV